jgi:methionyl-tRNA formyltransferase
LDASQETAYSLEAKAQEEMIRLFVDVCMLAETGDPLPVIEQDRNVARYLNRQQMEALKEIPEDADEKTIDRFARAFWYPPYECAYLRVGGKKVEVIPNIAREHLGAPLHAEDLNRLQRAIKDYQPEKIQ